MSEAIPGLELMTALQNQTNQGLQAMQFGVQARQNERQLGQADVRLGQDARRLDMAQKEYDDTAPQRAVANKTAEFMMKGNRIEQKVTSDLAIALAQGGDAMAEVMYNTFNTMDTPEGYASGYQYFKDMDIDPRTKWGLGETFNPNSMAQVKSLQNKVLNTYDRVVEYQKASREAAAKRAEINYRVGAELQADLTKLGSKVKTTLQDAERNEYNQMENGSVFDMAGNQVTDPTKLKKLTSSGNQKGRTNATGMFIGPDASSTTATQENGQLGVVIDGQFLSKTEALAKGYGYNPATAEVFNKQNNAITNNARAIRSLSDVRAAYRGSAAGMQPGTVLDITQKYVAGVDNLFGGAVGNALGDALGRSGEAFSLPELKANVMSIASENAGTPEGALAASMYSAAVDEAALYAGEGNSITKQHFISAFRGLYGVEPSSLGTLLQDPKRVEASMSASMNRMFDRTVDSVARINGVVGGYRAASKEDQKRFKATAATLTGVTAEDANFADTEASGSVQLPQIQVFVRPDGSTIEAATPEQVKFYTAKGYKTTTGN